MAAHEELKRRVAEAIGRFENDQMSVRPESVSVDIHPRSLVVSFQGAVCPAERDYARDRQAGELLQRLYDGVFEAAKPVLESAIQDILGVEIDRSRLIVIPQTGDAVILFTFLRETSRGDETNATGGCRAATK